MMSRTVAVLDSGASNLPSLVRVLRKTGYSPVVLSDFRSKAVSFDCLLIPGVGNFGHVMGHLENIGAADFINCYFEHGRPILGICLGAQLLFSKSEESPNSAGFGFIPGGVQKLEAFEGVRVPHVGWNLLKNQSERMSFLDGFSETSFYFSHSYRMVPDCTESLLAVTTHGAELCSVAGYGQLVAVQFHPEKSGRAGQRFLRESIEWLCRQT